MLALSLMICMLSCAPSQNASSQVPGDLVVRYAEGGGFTGQWTGAVIRSDGSVHAWSPTAPDSTSRLIGIIPRSILGDLWRSADVRKLLDQAGSQEAGNMTRTISISAQGKEVVASWPFGPSIPSDVKPFAAFYEECRQAVSRLKQ